MSSKDGAKVFVYSFGIHMGLCRGPIDELVETTVGDRRIFPVGGTVTSTTVGYTGEDNHGAGPAGGEAPGDGPDGDGTGSDGPGGVGGGGGTGSNE